MWFIHPYHNWKHFRRFWPFVRVIHQSLVNSPHKGHWGGALIFFICAWTNGYVNNQDADLRRHRAHYDVTAMKMKISMNELSLLQEKFSIEMFLPEASIGQRVLSSPVSVCVCVRQLFVRVITHHTSWLESSNLKQKKSLRSLPFAGWLTLTFQVKFNFLSKFCLFASHFRFEIFVTLT